MVRKRRPASRARPLPGPPPATELSPGLVAVCASGERAVTVFVRYGTSAVTAALGSPADPEMFAVWRTQGISVFLAGDLPIRLQLGLAGARVKGSAQFDQGGAGTPRTETETR